MNHFDWRKALNHGVTLYAENIRDHDTAEAWVAMWELLCEAARVSRSYEAPPRSDYPEKGAWPDAPDEMTHFQRGMAYLRGEIDEAAPDEPLPPIPTAAEITRADAVLALWHNHALCRPGGPLPAKRAIYALAEGKPLGAVMRMSGMNRHEVLAMRKKAAEQMLRALG